MRQGLSFLVAMGVLLVSTGSLRAETTTKESAVKVLQDLLAALEAKDHDKAVTYFQVPPGTSADEMKIVVAGLLAKRELSKDGIEVLSAKGRWGKLAEVFPPERAKEMAGAFKVPVDECWGFKFESAEAGMRWDGKAFKLIRCDDIGKLKK